MDFLGSPEKLETQGRNTHRRREITSYLIARFSTAFPQIEYDLLWESASVNAQAWRLGMKRAVRVYGGVARHRRIGISGLAVMLAHETGHHLGGFPRDPDMPWMTWQGQADYWGARVAMPVIFGSRALAMTLRGARQILDLHRNLTAEEPDLSPECRYSILVCGALGFEFPICGKNAFEELQSDKAARL
jgi:hypothetical protein